jgi:7-cyano-7-deazaguanine synthase
MPKLTISIGTLPRFADTIPQGKQTRPEQKQAHSIAMSKLCHGTQPAKIRKDEKMQNAVVLLSGGLDSTTVLAIAKAEGFSAHALSFRYGQRHAVELEAAQRVASALGVIEHVIADIDLRRFGGSALTADIAVPKGRPAATMAAGIPVTYVPARNTVFLSFALAWAEVLKANDIFIGVNALDYSGYPDCRPEYIAAYERMANLATAAGIEGRQQLRIHTPLIDLSKAQIIQRGIALGIDYGLTSSCYDPDADGRPCRQCDSCQLRAKGFAEAGLSDPLLTRHGLTQAA